MKRVVILGHFAFGFDKSNGQTIKTKVIAEALVNLLGDAEVDAEDTMGGWKFLMRLPVVILRMLRNHWNVVILPAYKGVRVIVPMLVTMNLLYRRKLHYVVIGGWLPSYAKSSLFLRYFLKRLDGILVETEAMRKDLEMLHFQNVEVMPNCKPLAILPKEQIPMTLACPYKLCTFSRVIKEKGIEEAIAAVRQCNEKLGRIVYALDIYGGVEQQEWFDALMKEQPETITYKGVIPFNKSTDVLKDYFLLLFPTYYKGEAFAGTLIDAMAAGLPTIASDWHANPEIVKEGVTGLLFPVHSVDALVEILMKAAQSPASILRMREECIKQAAHYQPDVVIQTLACRLAPSQTEFHRSL